MCKTYCVCTDLRELTWQNLSHWTFFKIRRQLEEVKCGIKLKWRREREDTRGVSYSSCEIFAQSYYRQKKSDTLILTCSYCCCDPTLSSFEDYSYYNSGKKKRRGRQWKKKRVWYYINSDLNIKGKGKKGEKYSTCFTNQNMKLICQAYIVQAADVWPCPGRQSRGKGFMA